MRIESNGLRSVKFLLTNQVLKFKFENILFFSVNETTVHCLTFTKNISEQNKVN